MVFNFLFHRVSPIRDPLWDPMDVKLFERCIQYITRNYHVVLLEDIVLLPETIKHSPKPLASISFDDGYKDNMEYAAPILEKYNCKASFYVVTDCIEYNRLTWTHVLEYAFQHTQQPALNLDFHFLPVSLRVKKLFNQKERFSYINQLKPYLRTARHEIRDQVVARVSESYCDVSFPKMMMNWKDLRSLKAKGHYIGSHSLSHAVLNTIEDDNVLSNEIELSGKAIEKEMGYFPLSLSYPLGKYNTKTIQFCKDAGYKMGLAVEQCPYNPKINPIFEIPRMELYNEKWWKTWLRLNNSQEKIKKRFRK